MRKISLFLAVLVVLSAGVCFSPQGDGTRPRIILGLSQIELKRREAVGVQVDRVIRDIAWQGSAYDVQVPPDRVPENLDDLVPYMEGMRAREMMLWAGVKIFPLTPARGKEKCSNDCYYFAADGQGNFPFLIDPSKVDYQTAYPVPDGSEDEADIILPDTHGFNMVAEQAYLHREELYLVMACMDTPAKADAALYLAQNGLHVYAPCDRFTNELMNYRERFEDVQGTIIGSAPVKKTANGAVIGNQPLIIYLDEPIIVQYTDRGYPDFYSDTPWRYFTKLTEFFNIELEIIQVTANVGETHKVIEEAEAAGAQVIAVRINNEDDYQPVADWFNKDPAHRAVLLHSACYEWGAELFAEFPAQTSFGDLMPRIER